ncbi:hypothetical protein GCM10027569_36120 [Flindersiella endophytica]
MVRAAADAGAPAAAPIPQASAVIAAKAIRRLPLWPPSFIPFAPLFGPRPVKALHWVRYRAGRKGCAGPVRTGS